jgi:hypothetical protein
VHFVTCLARSVSTWLRRHRERVGWEPCGLGCARRRSAACSGG